MAAAWPLLQTLEIAKRHRPFSQWPPAAGCPTVRALAIFAERCPSLKTLVLGTRFQLTNLPSTTDGMPPPSTHALRHLEVGLRGYEYDEETRSRLALYVDALFPNFEGPSHPTTMDVQPKPTDIQTPTSRALGTTHIVELVMDQLFPLGSLSSFPPISYDRNALAIMARVSKAFSPLALARLWHTIADLSPLIFVLAPESQERGSARSYLHEKPSDADWARFDSYSKYVRRVEIILRLLMNGVDWDFFLSRYSRDKPILPHVVCIDHLDISLPDHIVSDLLPPNLQQVRIVHGGPRPCLDTVITLSATALNVQKLTINYKAIAGETLAPLETLKSLKELNIECESEDGSFSAEFLATLRNTANIRHLSLERFRFPAQFDYRIFGEQFQNLEYLSVTVNLDAFAGLATFMQVVSPPLSYLHIGLAGFDTLPTTPQDSSSINAHIAGSMPRILAHVPTTLQNISMTFTLSSREQTGLLTVHPCFVAPTLHLRDLTSVEINNRGLPPTSALDDASLAAMAAAWPHLRTLDISSDDSQAATNNWSPAAATPTVVALAVFAARSPALRTLVLRTRVSLAGLPAAAADVPPPSGHRLRRLVVGLWRDKYDEGVRVRLAAYVDALFPHLQGVLPPGLPSEMWHRARCGDVSSPFGPGVRAILYAIQLGRRRAAVESAAPQ
ncbi:uncharacterized protein BXZ73DRAFT_103691 [Epithele typhae]|uniref:uncharacterized protein n=1 Tax=Epithele typhae TaxID=378194 RepID=UPI0020077FFD|nr:uncharacterized protein BXZ73DRAFT_103691 [Epithele typhae]KAH9923958.1 hypothetical protein BXZ73DRAFT_103691 [Epithele typhae]